MEILLEKKDGTTHDYIFSKYKHKIPTEFNNNHLPNLRAKFIQESLKGSYRKINPKKVHILDGVVNKDVNREDRNVTIILYVQKKLEFAEN